MQANQCLPDLGETMAEVVDNLQTLGAIVDQVINFFGH